MLALTLLEDIGLLAGVVIFALILVVILRPLTLHITLRHEESQAEREAKELIETLTRLREEEE